MVEGVREHGESRRREITEQTAENRGKTKYRSTPQFQEYVQAATDALGTKPEAGSRKKAGLAFLAECGNG